MMQARKNKIGRYVRGALVGLGLSFYLAAVVAYTIPKIVNFASAKAQYPCFDKKTCTEKEFGIGGDFEEQADCTNGWGYCYAKIKPYQLIVPFGGNETIVDIGDYIQKIYTYATGIASVVAAVIMMIGGFQILTAGGDSSRVTAGKQKVTDALIGLFLALGAYLMLNTISPDLVKLQLPRVPIVRRQDFIACSTFVYDVKCGDKFGVAEVVKKATSKDLRQRFTINDGGDECLGRSCAGAGLSGSASWGESFNRCRPSGSTSVGVNPESYTHALTPTQMGNGYECGACIKYGKDCVGNGLNDTCCGGYCSNGKCTNGNIGDSCERGNECRNGVCETKYNKCGAGSIGSSCKVDGECGGLLCVQGDGRHFCAPSKIENGFCNYDSDCPSGIKCDDHVCYAGGGEREDGASCGRSQDCANGTCVKMSGGFLAGLVSSEAAGILGGICSDGQNGSVCKEDNGSECISGHCFVKGGTCVAGVTGDPCSRNEECESGKCHPDASDPNSNVAVTASLIFAVGRCMPK